MEDVDIHVIIESRTLLCGKRGGGSRTRQILQILRHFHICYQSWQGSQFWNRTFEEELSKVDIAEVQQLIDEGGENEKEQQC